MVTIWPSFINCLITSDALTLILCARSATLMVSGTCTSCTCCSAGATKEDTDPSLRSPRRPPRGARQPARAPPGASLRVLRPRFFAASSAQLEDSFSDLTDFLSPGLATTAPGAPGAAAGLWIVPLMPSLPASTGFGASSGFLAFSTFFGADIMARMAAASSSAALRRLARSIARCLSSSTTSAALITRNTDFTGSTTAGGTSGAASIGGVASAPAFRAAASRAAAAAAAAAFSASARARASAASRSARSCSSRWR